MMRVHLMTVSMMTTYGQHVCLIVRFVMPDRASPIQERKLGDLVLTCNLFRYPKIIALPILIDRQVFRLVEQLPIYLPSMFIEGEVCAQMT